jgi:hypothetical protein
MVNCASIDLSKLDSPEAREVHEALAKIDRDYQERVIRETTYRELLIFMRTLPILPPCDPNFERKCGLGIKKIRDIATFFPALINHFHVEPDWKGY